MYKFSIICPTLNEEKHIEEIISVFVEHCPQPSELFVADAGSTDGTRNIVQSWREKNARIHLIENKERYVSYAFNMCYSISSGKYLALLGAHTRYPTDFFRVAYSELEAGNADAVGGPLRQVGNNTVMSDAIAWCMSTKFGVGGSEFRVHKKRMYVDSVAFAFYKRQIFEKVGLFDTTLKRNQDDEMHYRMNAAGYRILMVPEMECEYHVRSSLASLFKQYFEYGLYKPQVIRKVAAGLRIRHLIPAIFCLYLFSLPIIAWTGFYFLLVPLLLYLILLVRFSFISKLSLMSKLASLVVYPVLHFSYGLGCVLGLFKLRRSLS